MVVVYLVILSMVFGLQATHSAVSGAKGHASPSKKRVLCDEVVAYIDGPERRYAICMSELNTPDLNGQPPSIEDLILTERKYQERERYKIPMDVNHYMNSIKKQFGLTDRDFNAIFERAGLTREMGLEQLTKIGSASMMNDFKVFSRIFVAQHEVEDYYKAHPVMQDPTYTIVTTLVPYTTQPRAQQKKQLQQAINKGAFVGKWSEPFTVTEQELAADKRFITTMQKNAVVVTEQENGFVCFKMVERTERTLVPLEKRFREINDILRLQKAEVLLKQFDKELLADTAVVYLSPSVTR
jgi:hypothetical protein